MSAEMVRDLLMNLVEQLAAYAQRGIFYNPDVWENILNAAGTASKELYGGVLPTSITEAVAARIAAGLPVGVSDEYTVGTDGTITKL